MGVIITLLPFGAPDGGSGDVTASGTLTDNQVILGNGAKSIKAGTTSQAQLTEAVVTTIQNEFILGALLNNAFFETHEFRAVHDTGIVYCEIWSTANSYGAGTTYNRGNQTIFSNMRYFSLIDSNTGNQPDISPTKWKLIAAADFNLHGFVEGSNRIFNLDTTTGEGTDGHDRIAMTAGTDAFPVRNYVYAEMNGSLNLQLGVAPTEPTSPAIVLGYFDIPTVATFLSQSNRPANQQRFTNGLYDEGLSIGQQQALRKKSRHRVTYDTGIDPTLTITTNGGAIDNVVLTTTIGMTEQLWPQIFDAQIGTPTIYCLNHPTNPITTQYSGLEDFDVDANNVTLRNNNDRYRIRCYGNQTSGTDSFDAIFVMLPTGKYGNDENALKDTGGFDVTIPIESYIETIFNIGVAVLRHQTADSGTMINVVGGTAIQDKRGEGIGAVGGQGPAVSSQTEFSDAVFKRFNATDPTKQIVDDVSNVTTATTRTLTHADRDLDLGELVGFVPNEYSGSPGSIGDDSSVMETITLDGDGGNIKYLDIWMELDPNEGIATALIDIKVDRLDPTSNTTSSGIIAAEDDIQLQNFEVQSLSTTDKSDDTVTCDDVSGAFRFEHVIVKDVSVPSQATNMVRTVTGGAAGTLQMFDSMSGLIENGDFIFGAYRLDIDKIINTEDIVGEMYITFTNRSGAARVLFFNLVANA